MPPRSPTTTWACALPALRRCIEDRGISRQAQKDYAAAIADYDRAIALDPRSARAYRYRASARHLQLDFGERDRRLRCGHPARPRTPARSTAPAAPPITISDTRRD